MAIGRLKLGFVCAVLLCNLLLGRPAAAEVTISKSDDWDVYTAGRVNGFLSYGWGDANPIALKMGSAIPLGGGLSVGNDSIPKFVTGADGTMTQVQGQFQSMRVRSGFVPNVLTVGLRRKLSDTTTLNVVTTIWGTIESAGQRKGQIIYGNVQEGYGKVEGRWGSFLAGRALDLFSRGATENEFLYGHGYSLGFPGNIDSNGPAAGLISFGVLAAFFSPGLVYATPKLAGLQLTVGIYDPAPLPGGYEATRLARPEGELTYDLQVRSTKLHLFGNGMYQEVYRSGSNNKAKAYGVGYGGRVEVGPVHLGVAGHYGPGLGLDYALQAGPVSVSETFELRTFDGYSALLQLVAGRLNFNLGWGISRCFLLESDRVTGPSSILKRQIGYSAAIVMHATEHIHLSIDALRGDAAWFQGEKQIFTFVNTGMTVTW